MLILPLVVALSIQQPAQGQTPTPEEEALHNDLRALKDRATDALNRHDIDALLAETHPNVVFTAMNNEVVRGHDEVRKYIEKMLLGDNRIIQDIKVTFEPDALSVIYGGDNAIAAGSSRGHFKLTAGLEFDVDGRWTADLVKENDRWLIAAFHYSVNVFDNPLLNSAKKLAWYAGGGAGIIGLIVGFFVGRRRRG